MSSYFLFASPQSVRRISSAQEATRDGLLIEVRDGRASYQHQGTRYSIAIPSRASDDQIAEAVEAHLGGRYEEGHRRREKDFQGHGPVFGTEQMKQYCQDYTNEALRHQKRQFDALLDGHLSEFKILQDQLAAMERDHAALKANYNALTQIIKAIYNARVMVPSDQ